MGKEPYEIPDYTEFKVEDAPLLCKTQEALRAQGLCDPWLRNEVWRYAQKEFGTEKQRLRKTFFTGFRTGLIATVLTVVGTYVYEKYYLDKKEMSTNGKKIP